MFSKNIFLFFWCFSFAISSRAQLAHTHSYSVTKACVDIRKDCNHRVPTSPLAKFHMNAQELEKQQDIALAQPRIEELSPEQLTDSPASSSGEEPVSPSTSLLWQNLSDMLEREGTLLPISTSLLWQNLPSMLERKGTLLPN